MIQSSLVFAADSGGNFLVKPETGPMIWTLIAFGITLWILAKFAFPRIRDSLDRRQQMIDESIESAQRERDEAKAMAERYRKQLAGARAEADEIVDRARKTGEAQKVETLKRAHELRGEILDAAQKEVQVETQRALYDLRNEIANLTIEATEKVTRKTLDGDDQKRIVEEALAELDFTTLAASKEAR